MKMFGTLATILLADSVVQWFAVGVGISVCTYTSIRNGNGNRRK